MTVKTINERHMTTVAELIEVLKNCRPEAIVRVRDEYGVLTHKIEVLCYTDTCYNPPRRVVQIDKELDQVFE